MTDPSERLDQRIRQLRDWQRGLEPRAPERAAAWCVLQAGVGGGGVDEPNEAHATCHGVSVAGIEQVLAAGAVFRPDRRGSGDHPAEGDTDGGRRDRVVVAHDPARRVLRPITAWELR